MGEDVGGQGGEEAGGSSSSSSKSWGITEAQAEALRTTGFVVIDGFLSEEMAQAMLEEAKEAVRTGKIREHRFQFGERQFRKPNIFEADLHDESMQQELPQYSELLFDETIVDRLSALMPELKLSSGPRAKTVKFQYNAGSGGCFPCHYDNAGRPSLRKLTVAVYLNPDWKEGDGGELVLMPFLGQEARIRPLMGRAAIFRSDLVLHRVLPSVAERYCFTIWIDSNEINSSQECDLTSSVLNADPDDAAAFLRSSPVQRALSRAVYADEYEASLLDCMTGAEGCEEMLEAHRTHIAQRRANPRLWQFVETLQGFKAPPGSAEVV